MSTVEAPVAEQLGPNAKYYEELEVGKEWVTPRRTISEADIVLFTAVTGDQNPVHTDEEFAKNSVFGARLLHGPAVFAIATGLEFRLGLKEGTAIAFLGMTWDMKGPVKAGDTLHVRQRVANDVRPTNCSSERRAVVTVDRVPPVRFHPGARRARSPRGAASRAWRRWTGAAALTPPSGASPSCCIG